MKLHKFLFGENAIKKDGPTLHDFAEANLDYIQFSFYFDSIIRYGLHRGFPPIIVTSLHFHVEDTQKFLKELLYLIEERAATKGTRLSADD